MAEHGSIPIYNSTTVKIKRSNKRLEFGEAHLDNDLLSVHKPVRLDMNKNGQHPCMRSGCFRQTRCLLHPLITQEKHKAFRILYLNLWNHNSMLVCAQSTYHIPDVTG